MKKRLKFSRARLPFFLFLSLFSAHLAVAQANQIAVLNADDEIQKLLAENKIPAPGVGVIRDGKLVQVKVFGELKEGEAAPFNTIFNVAFLTKPVTAMVALKPASAGKLNLDEPADKYWVDPNTKGDARQKKLTARLVLSHQTGFANWR